MARMDNSPPRAVAAVRSFLSNRASERGTGSTVCDSPFSLRRPAGELFHFKTENGQGRKVSHHAGHHDRH